MTVTSPDPMPVTAPACVTVATEGASVLQVPDVTACVVPLLKATDAVKVSVAPRSTCVLVEFIVIDVAVADGAVGVPPPPPPQANAPSVIIGPSTRLKRIERRMRLLLTTVVNAELTTSVFRHDKP